MGLITGTNYDPTTAGSASTASLLAMTAIDTTNLRLSFTAPANGAVTVRLRCTINGNTTMPTILLGILQGTTVIARQSPTGGLLGTALATTLITQEATFTVTGLTPGNNYTWDAAYSVEILLASTAIKFGGPNDTTGNNAFGGFVFEIWRAPNLLGSKLYDPSGAVSKATTAALAMTAIDTTNLRITFTAPASGNVMVRLRAPVHGATTFPQILLGVMSGSSVVGRAAGIGALKTTAVATAQLVNEAQFVVTGLTSGNSYTWDAAYGVETAVSSTGLKYGGPNDTTTNNAFGGFLFEVWGV